MSTTQVIARYPATGSMPLSIAGQNAAQQAAKAYTKATGVNVFAQWQDDYNDHSVTGHYQFTRSSY